MLLFLVLSGALQLLHGAQMTVFGCVGNSAVYVHPLSPQLGGVESDRRQLLHALFKVLLGRGIGIVQAVSLLTEGAIL